MEGCKKKREKYFKIGDETFLKIAIVRHRQGQNELCCNLNFHDILKIIIYSIVS